MYKQKRLNYIEAYSVLRYDKEKGKLYWKISIGNKVKIDDESGYIRQDGRTSYRDIEYKGIIYKVHRIIWLMEYGEFPQPPADEIDHIDGDGLTNRIENLRAVTHAEQCLNKIKYKNNTSGYTGVNWREKTKKWQARIYINRKRKYLGLFSAPELANEEVEKVRKEYGLYSERHGK